MRVDAADFVGQRVVFGRLRRVQGDAVVGGFGHQFRLARGFRGAGIFKRDDLFCDGLLHGGRGFVRADDDNVPRRGDGMMAGRGQVRRIERPDRQDGRVGVRRNRDQ